MQPFLVCLHDVTPAFAAETRVIMGELGPLLGRSLSLAVVPDWHGKWPLSEHPEFCRWLQECADERLLHGYFHRRRRGFGVATLLTEGCDEMNGLSRDETQRTLEHGQRVFTEVFGEPARGFLAPGWQRGHVHVGSGDAAGLEHFLGFFAIESRAGRSVPLTTFSWDCGRWSWLGHIGHGMGRVLQSLGPPGNRTPALAIHPRDLERGYWPRILGLVRELLGAGYEPTTVSTLLEARDVEVNS